MAQKGEVEALSKVVRDIGSDDGVMSVVIGLPTGDFHQTLPVEPRGT